MDNSLCKDPDLAEQVPPPLPTLLDGYRLGPLVGEGGQGRVFRARRLADGATVAVKLPRPALVGQILREAELTRALVHPHIVRCLAVGETCAVYEYCASGSLADLLTSHPRGLPLDRVRSIAREILAGLAAIHERGLLHRDLKPSNVLFDASGRARLCDLGLAAAAEGELDHSIARSVALGPGTGTPLFMAPEQRDPALLEGDDLDARADLYAFGKVLFAMLTGQPPQTILPPTRMRPELSPAWDDLVFALVASDRSQRPDGIPAVRELLDKTYRARPAPQKRGGWGVAGRVFAVIGGVLAVLASVVVSVVGLLMVGLSSMVRGCQGEPSASGTEVGLAIGSIAVVVVVTLGVIFGLIRVFRRGSSS